MSETEGTTRPVRGRPYIWFGCAMLASMIVGSRPARGAAQTCVWDEYARLDDPVVTVIEGPGDAAEEQGNWNELTDAFLFGAEMEITLGKQTFRLERKP